MYRLVPVSATNAAALEEAITRLSTRIEKLEGAMQQLRVQTMYPSLYCPRRKEFQSLEERVVNIEKSPARAPLPTRPHP